MGMFLGITINIFFGELNLPGSSWATLSWYIQWSPSLPIVLIVIWYQLHDNCDHFHCHHHHHSNDYDQTGAMCVCEREALQRPQHWRHGQPSRHDWGKIAATTIIDTQSLPGERHLQPGAEGGEGDQEGGQVHVGSGEICHRHKQRQRKRQRRVGLVSGTFGFIKKEDMISFWGIWNIKLIENYSVCGRENWWNWPGEMVCPIF